MRGLFFVQSASAWLAIHPMLARLAFVSVELAVLGLAVALAIRLLRVRTPRVRALLWLLVLAKPVLGLAIGTPLPLLRWEKPAIIASHSSDATLDALLARQLEADRAALASRPAATLSVSATQDSASAPKVSPKATLIAQSSAAANRRPIPWSGALLGLWLAGVAWGVGQTLLDQIRIARIRRSAAAPDEALARRFADLAIPLGLRKVPELCLTDTLESPALVGVVRPAVLLPKWMADLANDADRNSVGRLDWVLRHELTHWKLNDPAALAVRRLAEIMLFFHPCVWWAGRRWEEAMELACDRALLATDRDAREYAEQLYRVLEHTQGHRRPAMAAGLFATRTQIGRRIEALLADPLRNPAKLNARSLMGMLVAAILSLSVGFGFSGEAKVTSAKAQVGGSPNSVTIPAQQTPSVQTQEKTSGEPSPTKPLEKEMDAYLQALLTMKERDGKENALINYARASILYPGTGALQQDGMDDLIRKVMRDGWSSQAETLLPYLNSFGPAFDEIRKGVALNTAHGVSYEMGFQTPVPNFLSFQICSKMLCVQGRLWESQGKAKNAIENYFAILAMGRDLNSPDATLISSLVAIAIQRYALDQLTRLAASGTLDRPTLEAVLKRLQAIDAADRSIRPGLEGEFHCREANLERIRKDPESVRNEINQELAGKPGLSFEDMVKNLDRIEAENKRFWDRSLAEVDTPYWKRDPQQFLKDREAMAGEFTAYSMIMIPNLTEADTRFLVMRAKLVGAELATALAICKADTGRYPAGLAELKPKYLAELPVDPFTGKPFEYAATEGGASFTLRSAGPDAVPDPAATVYDPTNGTTSAGDILLR